MTIQGKIMRQMQAALRGGREGWAAEREGRAQAGGGMDGRKLRHAASRGDLPALQVRGRAGTRFPFEIIY